MTKNKQFDLILCDLNMPIMDGYEFVQKIKGFYEQKQLFQYNDGVKFCPYIAACSSLVTNKIEQKALECGFDKVYESPMSLDILKELLTENVHSHVKIKLFGQIGDNSESSESNISLLI